MGYAATIQAASQRIDDCRLAARVEQALCASGYGPLRRITISVRERNVILEGHVPSYYLKQVAQSAVLSVSGIDRVLNDLEVV
jgi:osmotically-inducible protein OsmY